MNILKKKPTHLFLALLGSTLILGGCNKNGTMMSDTDMNGAIAQYTETEEFTKKVESIIDGFIKKQEADTAQKQVDANKTTQVENVSIDDDAILGDKNAPVTMIEFSDYECPFCKRAFNDTLPKIKEKYIDTGKVRLVFRDFPLSFHPNAMTAAIGAECAGEAGDDKYYEMHDLLYTTQDLSKENIKKLALSIGLNATQFDSCLDSEKYKDEVQKDMQDGQKYGVTGTPGFFINGWQLKGAKPYSEFEKYIEQELNK